MTTELKVLPPLSQSRQAKMACHFLYAETEVRGNKMPTNQFSERGTEIHRILATYINALVQSKRKTDLELFDTLIASSTGDAREILEGMRDTLIIDPDKVLGTEVHLALDDQMEPWGDAEYNQAIHDGLDGKPIVGPAYEGTPDFIQFHSETEAEIQDWKSYFQIVEPDTFQSKLYPLMLMQWYPGLERVTFRLEFVRYGIGREVVWTRAQVPMLKKLVLAERMRQMAIHQGVEAGMDALAQPGNHCVYCPLLRARKCPLGEANPYEMSPEDRLRWQIYLNQASKENVAMLRQHVDAGGPIVISDDNQASYQAGFVVKRRQSFPLLPVLDAITAWIKNGGDDFTAKLNISSTKLKGYLKAKKRAPLAEVIDPLKTNADVSEFRIGRANDPEEDEDAGA